LQNVSKHKRGLVLISRIDNIAIRLCYLKDGYQYRLPFVTFLNTKVLHEANISANSVYIKLKDLLISLSEIKSCINKIKYLFKLN